MTSEIQRIAAGVLDVAYLDLGPRDGAPVILLHGFPYDVHAFDAAAARLAAVGRRCIAPWLRGFGPTAFRAPDTPRSGQQAALGADLVALMDALAIPSAVLAGFDWGGRAACIVAALHPERARALVSCGSGWNIQNIAAAASPAAPEQEHRHWYQYYLHGERGRAGLSAHRQDFARLLWRLWSPGWAFDDATFARTAPAFDNPDFVEVAVHSYRHRFGLVPGDPAHDAAEARLAALPPISVPTVVLSGAEDGVDPPRATDLDAPRFSGPHERRILPGVGHNPPQEAPDAFADAVLALG